jgi:hypothetical protein
MPERQMQIGDGAYDGLSWLKKILGLGADFERIKNGIFF